MLKNFLSFYLKMQSVKISDKKALSGAARVINAGGIVVCPTDTVYGFLADAGNKKAIEKIFKIKKRPKSKPLPVFVSGIKQAKQIAEISKEQEKILKKHWPGKFTFILRIKKKIEFGTLSNLVVGRGNTIGIRIPKHKFLLSLLKKFGKPLAQTSVNISGRPELDEIEDIAGLCQNFVSSGLTKFLIVDGGCLPKRKPSTIIDLSKNKTKILRK